MNKIKILKTLDAFILDPELTFFMNNVVFFSIKTNINYIYSLNIFEQHKPGVFFR